MTKHEVREFIKRRRGELSADWLALNGDSAEGNFLEMSTFQSASVVACYIAIYGEVATDRIISRCWDEGKTVCVPAYERHSKKYDLAVMARNQNMTIGHMGISEPTDPEWISVEKVDLMVVPGLAFDRRGGRVGYGGGYYDRLLKGMSGVSAGLAFGFQVMDDVPVEEHDIRLDMVVTETEIITIS